MALARAKYLGIIKEAGWGTGIALVPTTFLEFLTCSVKKTVEKIQSAVNINQRYINDVYPGSEDIGGSFDIEVNPDNIGLLMYMALGVEAAQSQVLGNVAEDSTVTCAADVAGSLSGCYWLLEAPGITSWYVWYDVAGMGSVDPALPGKHGIVCGIAQDALINAVASATALAIELASAIRLAIDLKYRFNDHFADVLEHLTAPDTVNVITTPDPVTEAGLIALVSEQTANYILHDDDAEPAGGLVYHNAQEAADHSLTNVAAPANIAQCITWLLDIKIKFSAHDDDDDCHGTHGTHQCTVFHDFDITDAAPNVVIENREDGAVADVADGDTGWAAGNFVVNVQGSGGLAYDHVFTMATDATDLDSFVLEVGKEIKQMRYAGVMVNTVAFAAAKGSILKATFGVLGKSEDDTVGAAGPTYSPRLAYVFDQGQVKIDDAVVAYVKSFDFTIDNLLDADGFMLDGTHQRGSLTKQGINITGTMTLEYTAAAYAQRTAYLTNAVKWLNLTFTSPEEVEAGYNYTMEMEMKYVKYIEAGDDIGGRDAIPLTIGWVAKAPAAGQEIIKVTLRDAKNAKWSA